MAAMAATPQGGCSKLRRANLAHAPRRLAHYAIIAIMQNTAPHHRRFAGYDYSLGASLFVTVAVEPRRPVLGAIAGPDGIELSPFGEIAKAALPEAEAHFPGISIVKRVIMPDHVHFRIVVESGLADPVRQIGAFVGRFKQFSQWRIAQSGGPGRIWAKGYHDHICLSRQMNEAIDRYIENNPLKWWLMHGNSSLLHVREPLDKPWLPPDVFWRGAGDVDIGNGQRLVALRVSRSVPAEQLDKIAGICARGAAKGYIYISTFFSPGEHTVFKAVAERSSAPMVCLRADAIDWGYRPHGLETTLFGAGRLMVVARMEATADPARRPDLLWLNDVARRVALGNGGKAVYVQGRKGLAPSWGVETGPQPHKGVAPS